MKITKHAKAEHWRKFLDSAQMRDNLQSASLFLIVYEQLKEVMVDEIAGSFVLGFDGHGKRILSPMYELKVLALDVRKRKDVVHASCLWLQQEGVISAADVKRFRQIRKHRNDVTHELFKYVSELDHKIDKSLVTDACELLAKIDRWWVINFHIPSNPAFDGKEIDATSVPSTRMAVFGLIMQVLADKDEISALRAELEKRSRKNSNIE